ncbi:MAG: hypothetical protein FLDDKLPJ_00152 [Phycisphaerae bacterium]|nr:hypothetical protein [Phycisphaerae bacterium]
MEDDLGPDEVVQSILNADAIGKTLRSSSPRRRSTKERLYVITSFSDAGTYIYTKGKIAREDGREVYYILISAKISIQHG